MKVRIEFTADGNGTAFVREMDRIVNVSPPWSFGPEQIWNGVDDYRELQRVFGLAMRNGLSVLVKESHDRSWPFTVQVFGVIFGFAPVTEGWLVGVLTDQTELGVVDVGIVDMIFVAAVTTARHTHESVDVLERAVSVVITEQTEETIQDIEYLQMCMFLLKRFQRRELLRERMDQFVNQYIELVKEGEDE